MKRLLLILLLALPCARATLAQKVDTLAYDVEKVHAYQHDSRYDYNAQLSVEDKSILDRLLEWLMRRDFNTKTPHDVSGIDLRPFLQIFFIGLLVIIVAGIIYYLYKTKPWLFTRKKKRDSKLPFEVLEENIYSLDFEDEINQSLRAGDYKMAVRLLYLQTLRYLNDHGRISWQPYKTPTEYLYEERQQRKAFRLLTHHFLRIRYGNFTADRPLFEQMQNLQQTVEKGGTDAE